MYKRLNNSEPMTDQELQNRLKILKKISPWRFKVPGLKKAEIPLERITGKSSIEYWKKKKGYKSARIGPAVLFRGQKHYTIIVSVDEFFKKQDQVIKSWSKK